MKTLNLIHHIDPGHGWIEIHKRLLKELNLENSISRYSYRSGNLVYVEEDGDAMKLLNALSEQGYTVNISTSERLMMPGFNHSKIRNMERYQA